MTFQVTHAAAQHIRDFITTHNTPGPLRVFLADVKGCGDKSLEFQTGAPIADSDTIIETEFPDVCVITDLIAHPAFIGATLDLEVDNLSRRLVVHSEKMSTCGCGLSYSVNK